MSVPRSGVAIGQSGQSRVRRYWPGKAPERADSPTHEDDRRLIRPPSPSHGDSDDRRLRRLAENRAENKEEVHADHRRIRLAEIDEEDKQQQEEGIDADEIDEEALEEQRRMTRERCLEREREEEAALLPVEEKEEEEETNSAEKQMYTEIEKHFFTPSSQWVTTADRERLEAEQQRLQKYEKTRKEEKKLETKLMVVEKIREEKAIEKSFLEAEEPNLWNVDELDEAEEYEEWKGREFARIKRAREEKEKKEKVQKARHITKEEPHECERKKLK